MRKLVVVAAIVGGSIALIGLMHTPFAMSFFGESCPFETTERSPEERDVARRAATRRLAGEGTTTTRTAGRFELGVATRDDLSRWAATNGGACREALGGGLRCEVADETIAAELDSEGRVVALSHTRRANEAGLALEAWNTELAPLRASLGEPDRVHGRPDVDHLQHALLAQARAEYRRSDYFAAVSATRLGEDRYSVVATYRAID